jgi:hypothetical protein
MEMSASAVTEKINNFMGPLEDKIEPMREGADELDSRVRTLVRDNPAMTLFGALCFGYFVGRIIAKR